MQTVILRYSAKIWKASEEMCGSVIIDASFSDFITAAAEQTTQRCTNSFIALTARTNREGVLKIEPELF